MAATTTTTAAAAAAAVFVRVAGLLGLARKVLHYAQTETDKAHDEYAHTDARTRDAERRLPQLAFLAGEVGGQTQVLSRLVVQLSDAHDAAFAVYEGLEQRLGRAYRALEAVLAPLQARVLPTELCAAVAAPGTDRSGVGTPLSLLSYVDVDAVAQLKDVTVRRLDEVKASYAMGRTRCRQLQEAVEALAERWDQADTRTLLQGSSPCEECLGIQDATCTAMTATVTALQALVGRLQSIKETALALSAADVAALEAELKRLWERADTMEVALKRVQLQADKVDAYAARCDDVYRTHVRLLAEVDACASAIRADMSELAAAAAALAVTVPVLEGNVDEAEALVAWYHMYEEAYDRMLLELARRQGCIRQLDALQSKFVRDVGEVATADAEAQQAFLVAYAEYLPRPLADLARERLPELLVVRNPPRDTIAPLAPSIVEEATKKLAAQPPR